MAPAVAYPTHEPRVSETVPEISCHPELVANESAYVLDMNTASATCTSPSALRRLWQIVTPQDRRLASGCGVERDDHKRDPLDFAYGRALGGRMGLDSPGAGGVRAGHRMLGMAENTWVTLRRARRRHDLIFPLTKTRSLRAKLPRPSRGTTRVVDAPRLRQRDKEKIVIARNFVTVRDVLARNDPRVSLVLVGGALSGSHPIRHRAARGRPRSLPGVDEAERASTTCSRPSSA